jgi:hypothetical protein
MSQQSETRLQSFFFSSGNSSDQWTSLTAYVYQFVQDHLVSDGITVSGCVFPLGQTMEPVQAACSWMWKSLASLVILFSRRFAFIFDVPQSCCDTWRLTGDVALRHQSGCPALRRWMDSTSGAVLVRTAVKFGDYFGAFWSWLTCNLTYNWAIWTYNLAKYTYNHAMPNLLEL